MFIRKRVPLSKRALFSKRVPHRGTVLQKKVRLKGCPLKKKGTNLVPFFQRGTVSEQKKVENSTPLKRGTILVPLGVLFSLIIMFI